MNQTEAIGWRKLVEGYPWFAGDGNYPLPAYSEFMPSPRLGCRPYTGEIDHALFAEDDLYGWRVSEIEEEYELQPGLENIARQVMEHLLKLGRGESGHHIGGHQGHNLIGNPYWSAELAARAGRLDHERYVVLLPLALSRTQDDMGRVRWTLFGNSEQGPERAFWKSFFAAPDHELDERQSLAFFVELLARAYGETIADQSELRRAGFRILPSERNARLPRWTRAFLVDPSDAFADIRYLLTFTPFGELPAAAREKYLAGKLALLPFPGSLAFWSMPIYQRRQEKLPMGLQLPLLRLVARHGGPYGIRIPQSGWLHEPRRDQKKTEIQEELLLNTYRRTNRWNRVHRYEDGVAKSARVDKVTQVLFSTALESMELYDKPMARNAQIWSEDGVLLLDGPHATRQDIERAAGIVLEGGLFRYRFQFPPMLVGRYEVYWQRPIVAFLSRRGEQIETFNNALLGYLTAYLTDAIDLSHPVELFPRLLKRETYVSALRNLDSAHDHYSHQTALNVVTLLDNAPLFDRHQVPKSFARRLLRIAKNESLDDWLAALPERASSAAEGRQIKKDLEQIVQDSPALPAPLTFDATATRAFEEAYWQDILTLSHGEYINKDNADVVLDETTQNLLKHHHRDLERLGDYLIRRHRDAMVAAGMENQAVCGELPFQWETDFDFSLFGGWKENREGRTHERDILVVIPGKNRNEAVVLADHYDTAYMEDIFDPARGGSGARLAAAGADDNHSATATLLQAAPIFLRLAREGKLERDVWLLHLTGEEFPSDCLGARHFCQALVEKTLKLRISEKQSLDLSGVRVVGVYVMDMIAHNRDDAQDIFQISPGTSPQSLRLAYQAHIANLIWNAKADVWNQGAERQGKTRGKRSKDGAQIPEIALHPLLEGEVRTADDPASSLYNTDAQIFSDIGAPVVLFMENYDIDRTGYHDTKDTMENIDLDYGAALAAIAIETVAQTAALS